MGNTFGKMFKVTTFGESHNLAIGVIVDGCPAGLRLSEADIQKELDRRKPAQSSITTQRKEKDRVKILSGVFNGITLGTPISMIVYNEDVDSRPYEKIKFRPRPNHADLTYYLKYGIYDHRGGGRASGRETLARVAAGAIAKKILKERFGTIIAGHTIKIGKIKAKKVSFDEIIKNSEKNPVRCADLESAKLMEEEILKVKKEGDSIGGIVEVVAVNVPAGLGEPVFDKLDADIAKAMMSIGAVKGVEIGLGFEFSEKRGSEVNDEFYIENNKIKTYTNNSGGILGGISNGMPIVVRVAVKPTPSIAKEQRTVDLLKWRNVKIKITGRHDPCIVPRVVPVAEAMLALVLVDHAKRSGLLGDKL